MRAHYLFAIAENDDAEEPDAKDVLREAFAGAGLPAEIEVYEGTLHGWCPPDSHVYSEPQAERAWSRLLEPPAHLPEGRAQTHKESMEYLHRSGELTRRQFSAISAGVGLSADTNTLVFSLI